MSIVKTDVKLQIGQEGNDFSCFDLFHFMSLFFGMSGSSSTQQQTLFHMEIFTKTAE